jgi:hypothetical protein
LYPHFGCLKCCFVNQGEEDIKRMKIIGWKVKAEDKQEWSRIVEQTKAHPEL